MRRINFLITEENVNEIKSLGYCTNLVLHSLHFVQGKPINTKKLLPNCDYILTVRKNKIAFVDLQLGKVKFSNM